MILGSVGTPPCSAQPASADCIGVRRRLAHARVPSFRAPTARSSSASATAPTAMRTRCAPRTSTARTARSCASIPTDPRQRTTRSTTARTPGDRRSGLYGVRNPFGFSIQPGTDEIYLGDVGWNTWEEVDHGPAGTNFGWPCYEGNGPQPFFQANFAAQCALISPVTPPFYTYDHSSRLRGDRRPVLHGHGVPGSSTATTSSSPTTRGTSSSGWCSTPTISPVSVQPFATDVQSPVHSPSVPTGCSTTSRSRPASATDPLQRTGRGGVGATPTNGYSPLSVSFSSAGSSNPGGGQLSYLWDFGDGTTSTAANPSHTYTSSTVRTFTARLTVTSQSGQSSTDTVAVTVGSLPPTPRSPPRPTAPPSIPDRPSRTAGQPPIRRTGRWRRSALSGRCCFITTPTSTPSWAEPVTRGSFVAEDHGDDRNLQLRDHPHGHRQQRAEVQHQRQPPGR